MAILDVVESWIHTHRHLYMPATAPLHFPAGLRGFVAQSACMIPWFTMVYMTVQLPYLICAILAVGLQVGNGDPEAWPDLFGNLSDAYTIRHLWGYVCPGQFVLCC